MLTFNSHHLNMLIFNSHRIRNFSPARFLGAYMYACHLISPSPHGASLARNSLQSLFSIPPYRIDELLSGGIR